MDFKVNDHMTINSFELLDNFKMIMKFGFDTQYQEFSGMLDDDIIKGWHCTADGNLYDIKRIKITELKSVGCGIDSSKIVYPQYTDNTYDFDNGVPLAECIENEEWFETLDIKDRILILKK